MPSPLLEVARLLLLPGDTVIARAARNKAVSTAYYVIFSEISKIVADTFASAASLGGLGYRVAYQQAFRSLDHRTVRGVAQETIRTATMPPKKRSKKHGSRPIDDAMAEAAPDPHFATLIALVAETEKLRLVWASNCIALQEARHSADYDPFFVASVQEAESRILQAEEALDALTKIGEFGRRKLAFDLVFFTQRPSPRS